jgi:hypothetical protein
MRTTLRTVGRVALGLAAVLVAPAAARAATPTPARVDCSLVCAADCEQSCDPVCVAPPAASDCEALAQLTRNDPCALTCSLSPECDRAPQPSEPDTCQA